jgi:peptide/nickel transport system substrate-binding protein
MKGVNRSFIINRILNGQAIVADSPILPGSWAHYSDTPIEYDQEGAINLLKSSEYTFEQEADLVRAKDGVYLRFSLAHPDDPLHTLIAQSLQKDWNQLGVEVTLEPMPYEVLIDERLVQRNYEAALVDINLNRSPDPDPYPFWDQAQATGGQNYSQWDNNAASEYLEQARINFDISERIRLYNNFQVVFRKEMPAILLYYPVYSYAVDNKIQGVQMGPIYDPSDRLDSIKDWYLIIRRGTQPEETAGP